MDSGQIPPFHPDLGSQPEDSGNQKNEASLPEARRYTPEGSIESRLDKTLLPDYAVSSSSSDSMLSGQAEQLPEACPPWFAEHKDILDELFQYQQYFKDEANQQAFLNGDGPYYNPLIITRLRLQTILETESLTDEQKLILEHWQDAALKDCPIPWRTLPLQLNHLNNEWTPSPQAMRFIGYDAKNQEAQLTAGDFIPEWMKQNVLGQRIGDVTIAYWNIRNEYSQPGKNFLTLGHLYDLDQVLYNWLALFKDPRVLEDSGLSEQQIAVVEGRLSYTDREIEKILKKKKCNTKSHHYTWKQITATPELYEQVQRQLNGPPESERKKKKRTTSRRSTKESDTSSSSRSSVSSPTRKRTKRQLQDSLTSQNSVPDDMSVSSSEFDNGRYLWVNGKRYPYSEEMKYTSEPDVLMKLKIYEKPHMYDFETASENQIPEFSKSPASPTPDSSDGFKVDFQTIELSPEQLELLNYPPASFPCFVSVEPIINALEIASHRLYQCADPAAAEQLIKELHNHQEVLLNHFDKVYRRYTDAMYSNLRSQYNAAPYDKETQDPNPDIYKVQPEKLYPAMDSVILEEQLQTHHLLLIAQEELSELKRQATNYYKKLKKNPWIRVEAWQTSEMLNKPMRKTRECFLGQSEVAQPEREQLQVPVAFLARLKYLDEISHDDQSAVIELSPFEVCTLVFKNLNLLKKTYGNKMGIWAASDAKKECDHLLIVFDYFIEHLKLMAMNSDEASQDYQMMELLRADFQNFRYALKENDHTEMFGILSSRVKISAASDRAFYTNSNCVQFSSFLFITLS